MDWLRDTYGPKEIGVADLVAQQVYRHLADSPRFTRLYGGRIWCVPFRPLVSAAATHPEMLVTPMSNTTLPGAGSIDREVVVFVVHRFAWPRAEEMRAGDPGITTLTDDVERYLYAEERRRLPMETPVGEVRLADEMTPDAINYLPEGTPDKLGYAVVQPFRYRVAVWPVASPLFGRPRQLVEADYYS